MHILRLRAVKYAHSEVRNLQEVTSRLISKFNSVFMVKVMLSFGATKEVKVK